MKQKGTYSSRLRFDSSIFGFLINLYLLPLGELAPTKFYIAFILISRCSSKKKKVNAMNGIRYESEKKNYQTLAMGNGGSCDCVFLTIATKIN